MSVQTFDLTPTDQVAPPGILRDLRAVNRHATLIFVGGGRWWLGMEIPDWESPDNGQDRRRQGYSLLATENARDPLQRSYWRLLRGKLLLSGFRYIRTFRGEPTGRIVRWFEEAEYNFQHHLDERLAESAAIGDGSKDRARAAKEAAEYGRTSATETYRRFFRRPVSVAVNGFKKMLKGAQ